MSHLVHSLSCKCGHVFEPEFSSGAEACPKCKKMVVRPAEPTVEELTHTIFTAEKQLQHMRMLLQPGVYQRMVDFSLARISQEKEYLEKLRLRHEQAPARIEEYNQWMGDLLEQKQELILRKALATRSGNRSEESKTATNKKAAIERLRDKLGEVVFARLEKAFGSAEGVLEMWKQ